MSSPIQSEAGDKEYRRALLNILEDFTAERERFRSTQRAISNILEDYAAEKERLIEVQKAAMNILEDLALEKNRLEESQKNVLRSEQALRSSLHEKEVLLREVHHRVKNNLQLIVSLLNLQGRHLRDEQSRLMLEESQNRIHSIALVHETLYQSGELAQINLGEYLRTLARHLADSWIGVSGRLALTVDVSPLLVPIDMAIPCGLIVNELVSNAFKHAFPGERTGSVRVSLHPASDDRMILLVADDGIGLPDGVMTRRPSGLGMELVGALTRQLRGTLRITGNQGTMVEIVLPRPPPTLERSAG